MTDFHIPLPRIYMPSHFQTRKLPKMGSTRRLARFAESDSEDEGGEAKRSAVAEPLKYTREKKKLKLADEEEDPEPGSEETPPEEAQPIGEVIKTSGKGKSRRKHYQAFEYDGNRFELEDPVLLTPEDSGQKPYVAIIKEITQTRDGSMMVTGQWFYRPEEAEKKGGGSWEPRDTRELFYSFHRDEVPAESVMHKCVAHFVPLNKKLPDRSVNPGFIVQKVYDTVARKLWKLTDKDYEDGLQHEIDLLVQKTHKRLGEFVDIETDEAHQKHNMETEDVAGDQEEQLKNKRTLRRKNMLSVDIPAEDDIAKRSDQYLTTDTPGGCTGEVSEFYKTLATFKALSGDSVRDKWLEKFLQVVQSVFDSNGELLDVDKEKKGSAGIDQNDQVKNQKESGAVRWPDTAVQAVVAVEKAAHDALGSDFQKYNQKMRSLMFNLKNTALLSRRLVTGELEASVIPFMSANELKDGLTAKETARNEPDEPERMQMTDARCSRCSEKKVGLTDIIQAGGRGDRYQLECIACGYTWYAFRDEVSTLTIDEPSAAGNVGTAPWATAKFEDVEKKMSSPRESEKPDADIFKKKTDPYLPVLESQKSSNKLKADGPSTLTKTE